MRSILIFLWLLSFFQGMAQPKLQQQEQALLKQHAQIVHRGGAYADAGDLRSDKFTQAFVDWLESDPATMTYPCQKLIDSAHMYLCTSMDGQLRIYSWDTHTGGTMRFFETVYQYRANGKVLVQRQAQNDVKEPGSFCSKLFTVMVKDNPHYMAITNGIYSTKEVSQSINVFTIDNGKLLDTVKLFKTKTKLLNRIRVDYDFFSVVDRPERPVALIQYDSSQGMVYIPVVYGDGQVTHKNLRYQLKGDYFEYIGIAK